jgi:hypothetical protein
VPHRRAGARFGTRGSRLGQRQHVLRLKQGSAPKLGGSGGEGGGTAVVLRTRSL